MKRQEFLRRLRRFCRKTGRRQPIVDFTMGKGSHARVTVDGKKTTIPEGELDRSFVALLLKQLGLPRDALD